MSIGYYLAEAYDGIMPLSEISQSAQDYLKIIWQAQEWSTEPVTVKLLAERLGFRASTISEGIRKLAEQGMLVHQPYGSVELTELGKKHALAVVRRHRLIETFLVQVLHYTWDEVHDEAEVLEHAVSEFMIDRIDEILGFPERDPHGDPIPTASGHPRKPEATLLTQLQAGESGIITRISDDSAEMLRYFAELGLVVDQKVTVREHKTFIDSMVLEPLSGTEAVSLSSTASNSIWVAKS